MYYPSRSKNNLKHITEREQFLTEMESCGHMVETDSNDVWVYIILTTSDRCT